MLTACTTSLPAMFCSSCKSKQDNVSNLVSRGVEPPHIYQERQKTSEQKPNLTLYDFTFTNTTLQYFENQDEVGGTDYLKI